MEEWKPIIGYEWHYEISSLGRVKSLKYWKEIILKIIKRRWDHGWVLLYNKIASSFIVSRLVWIHFIPNPLNLPCVCHKDETLDERWLLYNWADNLWWGTYKDNSQDRNKKWRDNNHFKYNNPKKWKFWIDHFWSKIVFQYDLEMNFIRKWYSIMDARRFLNINSSHISCCCKWKRKTAGGFIWKYESYTSFI